MNTPTAPDFGSTRHAATWLVAVTLFLSLHCVAADAPQVTLNATKAAPRAVESLTERSVVRDYKFAWASLSQALESNSTAMLNGLFEGNASERLHSALTDQRRQGLSSRYSNQVHKLEAVFYSPEGDLMELHDTAEYDIQIFDGDKAIHNEHVVVHYVVLMTPAADRWVVRQLQGVPQF